MNIKLLALADAMAAAALSMNSHGYDQFIRAIEELIAALLTTKLKLEPVKH